MAADYWVLVPEQSEMNVAGVVKDAFVVTLNQGSTLDKQLLGNYTGKVTVGGRSGYLRAGPFTSQADVQAYLKKGAQNTGSPIPGVSIAPGGGLTLSNPFSGLAGIANAIAKFGAAVYGIAHALTDGKLWRSLGWLFLGALLVFAGLALWLRKPIENAVGQVIKGGL